MSQEKFIFQVEQEINRYFFILVWLSTMTDTIRVEDAEILSSRSMTISCHDYQPLSDDEPEDAMGSCRKDGLKTQQKEGDSLCSSSKNREVPEPERIYFHIKRLHKNIANGKQILASVGYKHSLNEQEMGHFEASLAEIEQYFCLQRSSSSRLFMVDQLLRLVLKGVQSEMDQIDQIKQLDLEMPDLPEQSNSFNIKQIPNEGRQPLDVDFSMLKQKISGSFQVYETFQLESIASLEDQPISKINKNNVNADQASLSLQMQVSMLEKIDPLGLERQDGDASQSAVLKKKTPQFINDNSYQSRMASFGDLSGKKQIEEKGLPESKPVQGENHDSREFSSILVVSGLQRSTSDSINNSQTGASFYENFKKALEQQQQIKRDL